MIPHPLWGMDVMHEISFHDALVRLSELLGAEVKVETTELAHFFGAGAEGTSKGSTRCPRTTNRSASWSAPGPVFFSIQPTSEHSSLVMMQRPRPSLSSGCQLARA